MDQWLILTRSKLVGTLSPLPNYPLYMYTMYDRINHCHGSVAHPYMQQIGGYPIPPPRLPPAHVYHVHCIIGSIFTIDQWLILTRSKLHTL